MFSASTTSCTTAPSTQLLPPSYGNPHHFAGGFGPCFRCGGLPQPTYQDCGDRQFYCTNCWNSFFLGSTIPLSVPPNTGHQQPQPPRQRPNAAKIEGNENQPKKKDEQKVEKNSNKEPPQAPEEKLNWLQLRSLVATATHVRSSSTTCNTAEQKQEKKTPSSSSTEVEYWCHPSIAEIKDQICVSRRWMAHSKKARYQSAIEALVKAVLEVHTPPSFATVAISGRNTFPVEKLAFLPALLSNVEKSNSCECSDGLTFITAFVEKAHASSRNEDEKKIYEEAKIKARDIAFKRAKAEVWKKRDAEKKKREEEEAQFLVEYHKECEIIKARCATVDAAAAAAAELGLAPLPEEDTRVCLPAPPKMNTKPLRKIPMPKLSEVVITEADINAALPPGFLSSKNSISEKESNLKRFLNMVPRTGVKLTIAMAALYIVYSHCSGSDLYALLIRFEEHMNRCLPAQLQAVSFLINLAGTTLLNNSNSELSAHSISSSPSSSSVEQLTAAKEQLWAIFEEYMDDHKERAIKSAIIEPHEFAGFAAGDRSSSDHVEANGRWLYLTAILEGLGGGSDRVERGDSLLELPIPVLPGEDDYQIGTHFAWESIKPDEVAEFKNPLHFGTSGFRNIKLLRDRAQEGGRSLERCADYSSLFGWSPSEKRIDQVRKMFRTPLSSHASDQLKSGCDAQLKLWAKTIEAFAFFFSKGFFLQRCFETLNTESRPEYAGFRHSCFTAFVHFLKDQKVVPCPPHQQGQGEGETSVEDQLYSYCYKDEYCTELHVENVAKFFHWLGFIEITRGGSSKQKGKQQHPKGPEPCGLEVYLQRLTSASSQHRVDNPAEEEEEVAPPCMLVDDEDSFPMTKTHSFEG